MFDASELARLHGARCEEAQGVLYSGVWQRARSRGAPIGRGIPQAVSCDNRYKNSMERDCEPLNPAEDKSGNCEMKFDSCGK